MYIHHPYLTINRVFRQAKLTANKQRDARNLAALQSLGYTVLTIWECEIKTILAQGFIPNLPTREKAPAKPDHPIPSPALIARRRSKSRNRAQL